jgi:hypothetical protein
MVLKCSSRNLKPMLPVQPKPEPANFNRQVRTPGLAFLKTNPNPKSTEWKAYWQHALPDMKSQYNEICSYCATWIPHSTGSHSIDHFMSKQRFPKLAYEWSNFRYVSSRFNSRKGTRVILDPFTLQPGTFIIDFTTLFIKPNSNILNAREQQRAAETIRILRFNDDDELVRERLQYYQDYIRHLITLDFLERRAPFISFEIRRQNLVA